MLAEIRIKEERLKGVMEKNGLDAIVLTKKESFSWITGGKVDYIYMASEFGVVDLLITKDKKYCITSKYERYRIMEEELDGLGYEVVEYDWWNGDHVDVVKNVAGDLKLGSDWDMPGTVNVFEDLKQIRYSLLPVEIDRYKEVCYQSALAVEKTCRQIQPGYTEHEVCADLLKNAMVYGIESTVALVASDERISKYRHPISTGKKVDKYVLVVICGRKYGLIASVSRFVHFGAIPQELLDKHRKVIKVDAEYITNTVPGRKVSDVFKAGMDAYKEVGYEGEWQLLHQGGPAGYGVRDYHGTPYVQGVVQNNQGFAWNPSITGTKSEDTFIVNESGFEIISNTGGWPMVDVKANDGTVIARPDILVR